MNECIKSFSKTLKRDLIEFLTLEEVKEYLKLDEYYNKKHLLDLIVAVRESAERFLNLVLVKREIHQTNYCTSNKEIELLHSPIVEIRDIYNVDTRKNKHIISRQDYKLNKIKNTIRLNFVNNSYGLTIAYIAGYDTDELPKSIKIGMLLHLESIYDNGSLDQLPSSAINFYSSYRKMRI